MPARAVILVLCLLVIAPTLSAMAGFDLSLGPYLGVFKPSLETFNDQVLLYEPRPAWGSATEFGLQVKTGLPLVGIGAGLNIGRWANDDQWTATAGPGGIYTLTGKYKIVLYPFDAFADYSLPIVPMVLKGRVGGSLGIAWGTMEGDFLWVVTATGAEADHTYFTAKGSTPYLGVNAGLDLVSIPKVTIGCDFGYRMGKIEQLKIKKADDPTEIGTILEYHNHTTGQDIPLPLELNGLYARLVARYHF